MRFWVRELAGWCLIIVGLYYFLVCLSFLANDRPGIFQSVPLAFIGFVVFRGGIHLLKVAMAARICMHADDRARKEDKRIRSVTSPSR